MAQASITPKVTEVVVVQEETYNLNMSRDEFVTVMAALRRVGGLRTGRRGDVASVLRAGMSSLDRTTKDEVDLATRSMISTGYGVDFPDYREDSLTRPLDDWERELLLGQAEDQHTYSEPPWWAQEDRDEPPF